MISLIFYCSACSVCFTGELIGVEYLYAQTGKVLQNSSDQQEEETAEVPDEDDGDEDEGFHVSILSPTNISKIIYLVHVNKPLTMSICN